MYCSKCGAEIPGSSAFCSKCGTPTSGERTATEPTKRFCGKCGTEIRSGNAFCSKCGAQVSLGGNESDVLQPGNSATAVKSKLAAGLLGIFLGGWGIHRFYLGFTGIGVVQIIVTFITFGVGGFWGFIEGILILTGSFNKDARGRPLKQD